LLFSSPLFFSASFSLRLLIKQQIVGRVPLDQALRVNFSLPVLEEPLDFSQFERSTASDRLWSTNCYCCKQCALRNENTTGVNKVMEAVPYSDLPEVGEYLLRHYSKER